MEVRQRAKRSRRRAEGDINKMMVVRGRTFSRALAFAVTVSAATLSCCVAIADTTAISAGDRHTLALREDGRVLAWGSDRYGQLGLGRAIIAASPTRVSGGLATRAGPNSLAGGDSHFIALQSDGTVWTWGSNRSGQLG